MLECLGDAVNNPDLAEPFCILRSTGLFALGGYQDSKTSINVYGTVGMASQEDIEMMDEADRVHEARLFHTSTPIYLTSEARGGVADILIWRGIKYRAVGRRPQPQRGYYAAVAVRMAGQ